MTFFTSIAKYQQFKFDCVENGEKDGVSVEPAQAAQIDAA
jgi:hypothetical protein